MNKSIDLRLITVADLLTMHIIWSSGQQENRIIMREDLELAKEAMLKLHKEPGLNPYNSGATSRINRIDIYEFSIVDDLWWMMPNLGTVEGEKAARLLNNSRIIDTIIFDGPPEDEKEKDGPEIDD